jgi:hypothetical protein
MEPGGSLPHSQEPATCPYHEPAQSSPCPPSHFWSVSLPCVSPPPPRNNPPQQTLDFDLINVSNIVVPHGVSQTGRRVMEQICPKECQKKKNTLPGMFLLLEYTPRHKSQYTCDEASSNKFKVVCSRQSLLILLHIAFTTSVRM